MKVEFDSIGRIHLLDESSPYGSLIFEKTLKTIMLLYIKIAKMKRLDLHLKV